MNIRILKEDIVNTSWYRAIEKAIEREYTCTVTCTGVSTKVNGIIYDNYNSNQDELCYKTCKMGLGLMEVYDFDFVLKKFSGS